MSTYVDDPQHPFGRMIMCHLIGDTLEELHAMADRIGVARRHFQGAASTPHYDLCKSKRALAVRHGAIEVDRYRLADLIRSLRAKAQAPLRPTGNPDILESRFKSGKPG